ncbi:MAG: hypothetical protein HW421_2467 [Ignavibacteria bacterium]|nr:hypothetical protein [Ignavibacteria bacterium]
MIDIITLQITAQVKFGEIIKTLFFVDFKLRIVLIDDSFIDVIISQKLPDKFGFHWETRNVKNEIFRYDNFPDVKWKGVETYPYHFHNGSQENVVSSPFPKDIIQAFYAFMNFVKERING